MFSSKTIAAAAALATAPALALADCEAEIAALAGSKAHAGVIEALDPKARAVFEREIAAARALAATERDRACRDVLDGAASLLADPRLADIISGYDGPQKPSAYGLDPAPQDQPDGPDAPEAPAA
jgi:hypothetical protein